MYCTYTTYCYIFYTNTSRLRPRTLPRDDKWLVAIQNYCLTKHTWNQLDTTLVCRHVAKETWEITIHWRGEAEETHRLQKRHKSFAKETPQIVKETLPHKIHLKSFENSAMLYLLKFVAAYFSVLQCVAVAWLTRTNAPVMSTLAAACSSV